MTTKISVSATVGGVELIVGNQYKLTTKSRKEYVVTLRKFSDTKMSLDNGELQWKNIPIQFAKSLIPV